MTTRGGRPSRQAVQSAFDDYRRYADQVQQQAALRATDRARTMGLNALRQQMRGAQLGGLANAMASDSDRASGRGIHRRAGGGWSASGIVYVRSGSERTRGALESYFYGADIVPVRGRWLWIPTEEAGRLIGASKNRRRITPALYRDSGQPLGPLIMLKSVNGYPLLAVKNVGKSMVGARGGKVRPLTKGGRPKAGDRLKQLSVLFVGIPRTSRTARVDLEATLQKVREQLPDLFAQEMGRR